MSHDTVPLKGPDLLADRLIFQSDNIFVPRFFDPISDFSEENLIFVLFTLCLGANLVQNLHVLPKITETLQENIAYNLKSLSHMTMLNLC
jgi:hypothetical protein